MPARVRALREQAGLTQSQLAGRLGVAFATVNRWENGHTAPSAALLSGLERLAGGTTASRAAPHPASRASTAILGRANELARLRELAATQPIVTLVGPGGSGKTRLAQELLQLGVLGEAHWIDLVPMRDVASVLESLARAAGVPPRPGAPSLDAIVAAIGSAPFSVVLDNCEHLADDIAAIVSDLRRRCPALFVLATSREALVLDDEAVFAVDPLALPAESEEWAAGLASVPAVQLFVERGRQAQPGFALTRQNGAAVVTAVRQLDGLPLALELAAAHLSEIDLPDLAQRLHTNFGLLARRRRGGDVRHHSLDDAIAWSYELLSGPERAALRALSVLVGRFDLDAGEAVVGSPGAAGLIAALVRKSLVQHTAGRYLLLETVRAFAAARLDDTDDGSGPAIGRLIAFFDHLLDTMEPDSAALFDRIDALLPSLRACFRDRREREEHATVVRLSARLATYFGYRGHAAEGLATITMSLHGAPATARPAGLYAASGLARMTDDRASAERWARQLVEESDDTGRSRALYGLATTLGRYGAWAEAHEAAVAAHARAVAAGNATVAFSAQVEAGWALLGLGRHDEALDEIRAARTRAASDYDRAVCDVYEADVWVAKGDLKEALQLLERGKPASAGSGGYGAASFPAALL
jgi:predicted ATPase